MKGPITEPWGKLEGRPGDPDFEWHPLRDHCVDVAAVCEALLSHTILSDRLARLAGLPALSEGLKARLVVLCFLHDLGKTNTLFQHKIYPGQKAGGHVAELVPQVIRGDDWLLEALSPLVEWGEDELPAIAATWLAAVCHHGKPVVGGSPNDPAWKRLRTYDPIHEARHLVQTAKVLFPRAWATTAGRFPDCPSFQHAYSGLVMLADWLGSDRRVFPYTSNGDTDRLAFAREAAMGQLRAMGMDSRAARSALPDALTFPSVFGAGFSPRNAQQVLADLPIHTDLPTTALLEAETGAGKTEAAVFHYLRLLKAGAVDGLYFALPTRTAATQIEGRLTKVLSNLFPDENTRPPLVLAVPGYLRVDGREGVRLPGFEVLWNDDEAERFRARAWAAESAKRYLAGAVVVGTIDQVLFSTLQVGHAHLRSTALMRHLLVVDEVHASDTYMNRLLTRVLARHREAGGHTLLMSATLGSATAALLLDQPTAPDAAPQLDLAYPLVTFRAGSNPSTRHEVVGADRPKRIVHELLPWLDEAQGEIERLVERAVAAAKAGARVLILRNTVRAALATQQALERVAPQTNLFRLGDQPTLHHSRYAPVDRRALDHQIETILGKNAPNTGVIVVATQTVQQSLDLNADLMFTDLCPMDVLLQRLGRLHRHDTVRPHGFELARVGILVPAERDLSARLGTSGNARTIHGLGRIYEDLRILEATWRELEAAPELRIPEMNRALVEATTTPSVLTALAAQNPALERHESQILGGEIAKKQAADLNVVNWTAPFGKAQFISDDRHITSRLGDSDLRIVLEGRPLGPFGEHIDELSMPHFLAFGYRPTEGRETRVETTPIVGGFAFTLGDTTYHYDRLGLRRADPTQEELDHVGA